MPLVAIDGLRLMAEEAGDGEPLVLVHGSWDDRSVWAAVIPELRAGFRVIAYDRRGHTDSDDGAAPGTRRADEDDLAALIDALDAAPAHVVGNSFGGAIVLGLAARRPELFRTVSVHEPPLLSLAGDPELVDGFTAAGGAVVEVIDRGEHQEAARMFVEDVSGQGPWTAMPAEERAMLTRNAPTFAGELRDPAWADIDPDALRRLDVPVLVTTGSESPPPFPAIVETLRATIPRADVRVVPGAGHVPHETHPAAYAALLRAFASPAARGR